jgi:hypothetical protein
MTAGIDGGTTGSFPKRPPWKWSLCGSEKSEYREYVYIELDVINTENREAKKKAAAATASSISGGSSKVAMPGTPRVKGIGQTPRRRLGI